MSKHARAHLSVQVAPGSDYRGGRLWGCEQTATPDEYVVAMLVDATTTPTTLTQLVAAFTTITSAYFYNEGSIAVEINYTGTGANAQANVADLPAGTMAVINGIDATAAFTLESASSTSAVYVSIIGT